LHAKRLIKHFGKFDEDLNFTPDSIQKIIHMVTMGCEPNIHMELLNTIIQEFLQSKPKNDGASCNFSIFALIEVCGD